LTSNATSLPIQLKRRCSGHEARNKLTAALAPRCSELEPRTAVRGEIVLAIVSRKR
jgi:hypothetical protein